MKPSVKGLGRRCCCCQVCGVHTCPDIGRSCAAVCFSAVASCKIMLLPKRTSLHDSPQALHIVCQPHHRGHSGGCAEVAWRFALAWLVRYGPHVGVAASGATGWTCGCGKQTARAPRPCTAASPQLSPKESSVNEYWQAIFLHNSAEPIQSVTIDGKPMKLET